MHEGKNIHYSPVDGTRPLCSYSLKVCRQRRLNGYAFCNRHILEDPTAPFKRCVQMSSRGKSRCSNPIPQDRHTDLCTTHQHRATQASSAVAKDTMCKATVAVATPLTTISPTTAGGGFLASSQSNGAALVTHTPPTTPPHTQDPQRLFIMDRLRNKFTRVQNSPSEDLIVNVVDDTDDPYAFPDTDAQPVQTSQNQLEPVESSQNQFVLFQQGGGVVFSSRSSEPVVSTERSSVAAVTMTSPLAMNMVTSLLHGSVSETTGECESSTMLPPTPPTGGTPIAKLYPELAGKLHASPVLEKPTTLSGKPVSSAGKMHCAASAEKCGSHRVKNISNSSNSSSTKSKSPSSASNSRSGGNDQRTMNKLQNKIAQNRIKHKIQKSKLKRESEEAVSPAASSGSDTLGTLPVAGSACSTAETTNTIYSLGSIPSLGNHLLVSQGKSKFLSPRQRVSRGSFPVRLSGDDTANLFGSSVTSPHVISSNVATVIPATVFTPFPNLACALSSLKGGSHTGTNAKAQTHGNTNTAANKSSSGASGMKGKAEKKKRVKNAMKRTKSAKTTKTNKSAIKKEDLCIKNDLDFGRVITSSGKGLIHKKEHPVKLAGTGFNQEAAYVTDDMCRVGKIASVSSQIQENNNKCEKRTVSQKNNHRRKRPKNLELHAKVNLVTGLMGDAENLMAGSELQKAWLNSNFSAETVLNTAKISQQTLCVTDDKTVPVVKEENSVLSGHVTGGNLELPISALSQVEHIKTEPVDLVDNAVNDVIDAVGGRSKNVKWSSAKKGLTPSQKALRPQKGLQRSGKNALKVKPGQYSSVIRRTSRFWKKAKVFSESEAKRVFRQKSAVDVYLCHARTVRSDMPLLKFGVCSSSEEDRVSPPLCSSCDHIGSEEEDKTCDNDLMDSQLLSTIRSTKISLVKSKCRRQLTHSKRLSRVTPPCHRTQNEATLALIQAARKDACTASLVVRAMAGEKVTRNRVCEDGPVSSPVKKTCLVENTETGEICKRTALPYTNHCLPHIMYNVDQQLFDYCTAKFSNNTQCCRPVVDLTHELPLCTEHGRKADNYQKSLKQAKKPRKKTKPSALTRPPKKGKKRRNQQQKRQNSVNSGSGGMVEGDSQVSVKDEELDELDLKPADLSCGMTEPAMFQSSELPCGEVTEVKVKVEVTEDNYTELEETFSPDTLDKTLELPLDMLEATKFLDKHDFGDMLNKLPDDAFDLFTAPTETAKPSDLTPTREETDLLEAAIAEASSSEFSYQSQTDLQRVATATSPSAALAGLCLPVSLSHEDSSPMDYISDEDDNEAKEDALTKQIASSLLHQRDQGLSDEEVDVMDQDNLNNLASSLTASDLNCISNALSGADLEMNLNLNDAAAGLQTGLVVNDGNHQMAGTAMQFVRQNPPLPQQQFQPQGNPLGLQLGLHNNTNNNQGHSVALQQHTPPTPHGNLRGSKEEETSEIGGQLAQILDTFRSDQSSMDRLQQNIRQFLSNDSPAPGAPFVASGGSPGNHQLHAAQTQQPQSAPVSAPSSILQEFLTMGKQSSLHHCVESPGSIAHHSETFPALLRQSSNDSSYSSGSGAAHTGHHRAFKHEPGHVTLIGSNNTAGVCGNLHDDAPPPNVSVTEIPPNVSVTDIPLSCQTKGPPNVTVTAIPAEFQSTASTWPPNTNSSAINIPSFSSIQAQLNMITLQLAAATNVNHTITTTTNLTPQKATPPKRTQARPRTPRSKKAKRSNVPQLTLDINAAANIGNHSSGLMATPDVGGHSAMETANTPQTEYIHASLPSIGGTNTPLLNYACKSPNKVPCVPPLHQTVALQQKCVPSAPAVSRVVGNSQTSSKLLATPATTPVCDTSSRRDMGKAVSTASIPVQQARAGPACDMGSRWDMEKTVQVSTASTAVHQAHASPNLPPRSPINQQLRTHPSPLAHGSPAHTLTQSPVNPAQIVGYVPVLGNQPGHSVPMPSGINSNKPTVENSPVGGSASRTLASRAILSKQTVVASNRGVETSQPDHVTTWQMAQIGHQSGHTAAMPSGVMSSKPDHVTPCHMPTMQKTGSFTVSTSTQAFLASLLHDTSAKKQQVTPEQQKMLQQLQQSAISAIPAVPSQQLQQSAISTIPASLSQNLFQKPQAMAGSSVGQPVFSASGAFLQNLHQVSSTSSVPLQNINQVLSASGVPVQNFQQKPQTAPPCLPGQGGQPRGNLLDVGATAVTMGCQGSMAMVLPDVVSSGTAGRLSLQHLLQRTVSVTSTTSNAANPLSLQNTAAKSSAPSITSSLPQSPVNSERSQYTASVQSMVSLALPTQSSMVSPGLQTQNTAAKSSTPNIVSSQQQIINSQYAASVQSIVSPGPGTQPSVPRYPSHLPKSPVSFRGTTLPALRSSPRQQPPLPRTATSVAASFPPPSRTSTSVGASFPPPSRTATSAGASFPPLPRAATTLAGASFPLQSVSSPILSHTRPTLMATSMQSVRIPVSTDLQKNICMLNPLLSNIIQQSNLNPANLATQKTSQGLPTATTGAINSNNIELSGASSLPNTVLCSTNVNTGVQGNSSSNSINHSSSVASVLPGNSQTLPLNPFQNLQSPLSSTSQFLPSPALSNHPISGPRMQTGTFSAKSTGMYPLPTNSPRLNQVRSQLMPNLPSTGMYQLPTSAPRLNQVRSQLMPNLPAPIVSTTIASQKVSQSQHSVIASDHAVSANLSVAMASYNAISAKQSFATAGQNVNSATLSAAAMLPSINSAFSQQVPMTTGVTASTSFHPTTGTRSQPPQLLSLNQSVPVMSVAAPTNFHLTTGTRSQPPQSLSLNQSGIFPTSSMAAVPVSGTTLGNLSNKMSALSSSVQTFTLVSPDITNNSYPNGSGHSAVNSVVNMSVLPSSVTAPAVLSTQTSGIIPPGQYVKNVSSAGVSSFTHSSLTPLGQFNPVSTSLPATGATIPAFTFSSAGLSSTSIVPGFTQPKSSPGQKKPNSGAAKHNHSFVQTSAMIGHLGSLPSSTRLSLGHTPASLSQIQPKPSLGHTSASLSQIQPKPSLGHIPASLSQIQPKPSLGHTPASLSQIQPKPSLGQTQAIPSHGQTQANPSLGQMKANASHGETQANLLLTQTSTLASLSSLSPATSAAGFTELPEASGSTFLENLTALQQNSSLHLNTHANPNLGQSQSNPSLTQQTNTMGSLPSLTAAVAALQRNSSFQNLPQLAATLQAQASLMSTGGQSGGGLKLAYPLTLPPALLAGLAQQQAGIRQVAATAPAPPQPAQLPRQPRPRLISQLPNTTVSDFTQDGIEKST